MTGVSTNYTTGANGAQNSAPKSDKPAQPNVNDQFMQLLMAQLRNQNPLEPMSYKDLMGQITQLNSLQELQKISASIQARDKSSGLTEAVGLIGKTVNYTQENGETGSGLVTGVSMLKNEVLLWIGETTIPLSAVSSVEAGGKNE